MMILHDEGMQHAIVEGAGRIDAERLQQEGAEQSHADLCA